MSGASGFFSSLDRLFSSSLDDRKLGADPGIGDIFSGGLLEPPINPRRAAGTSILEASGAGPPPPFLKDELDRAIEAGVVEPLSSLPTSVQGVPVKGRERLMEVFEQVKPILSGRAKTVPDIFKTIPKLPANTPDIILGDPNPPRLSGMSVREFLERIRRARESGI